MTHVHRVRGAMRRGAVASALALGALTLGALGCENAGSDRSVGLDATGVVRGFVYFDVNGSGAPEPEDRPVEGARVRLLSPVSRDTVWRATTGPEGRFRLAAVPIGSYVVVLDATSGGDSISVASVDLPLVTVIPDDSVEVTGTFGFAERAALEVRGMPLGTHVFVTGVALHARTTYSDSLFHVVDTSGAIRAVRVRPSSASALAGDSVRVRGIVATRLGQRVLDEVSVFVVTPTFIPPAATVSTGEASSALGGGADAALVRVLGATITDTVTVDGHITMTVDDGSGALLVRLDRAADALFRPPFPANFYQAGNTFDIVGVLVPTGTGTFVLRPRSSLDLTLR